MLTDQYLNMALTYLYRKASSEVKRFNKEKAVQKIAVEEDQMLFSKSRIIDTMSFAEMGDLGLGDIPVMGIRSQLLTAIVPLHIASHSTSTGTSVITGA